MLNDIMRVKLVFQDLAYLLWPEVGNNEYHRQHDHESIDCPQDRVLVHK